MKKLSAYTAFLALSLFATACGSSKDASVAAAAGTNMPHVVRPDDGHVMPQIPRSALISCVATQVTRLGTATFTLGGPIGKPSLSGVFGVRNSLLVTGTHYSYAIEQDFYRLAVKDMNDVPTYAGSIRFPGQGLVPQADRFAMEVWDRAGRKTTYKCTQEVAV